MSDQLTDAQIEAERRAIVKATVDKLLAEGAVIAHVTVAARLEKDYPGFEYIARVDNFRTAIDDTFPPVPAPAVEPVPGALAAVESVDELGAPVEPQPDPMDMEEFRDRIHEGELARGEIRSELYGAQAARVIARTILAQCIQAFISGRPKMKPHQLAKGFCADAAAERQAAKDVGRGAHPAHSVHHRSVLDQQLAYSSGGDSNDHVRSRFQTGHRRGAVPQATASRLNQQRALAAAKAGT
jgi:hypothetical protein